MVPMSTPMETDCDAEAAKMQPIDLSVWRRNRGSTVEHTTVIDRPPFSVVVQEPLQVQPVMQQQSAAAITKSFYDACTPLVAVSPQFQPTRMLDGVYSFTADSSSRHRLPLRPVPIFQFQKQLQPQQLPHLCIQQERRQQQVCQQQSHSWSQQLHQNQMEPASPGNNKKLPLDTMRQLQPTEWRMPVPSLSASSTESYSFPSLGVINSLPQTLAGFNYTCPYFHGPPGRHDHSDGQLSPVSTTSDGQLRHHCHLYHHLHHHHHHHHHHHYHNVIFEAAASEVSAEDVANIYRTPEFRAFRQRYLDSMRPPRIVQKKRRSVPADQQSLPGFDETYAQKRMKNNEAAKNSRDNKRQKFIENQISVKYLTKEIGEMNELKRRMLMMSIQ